MESNDDKWLEMMDEDAKKHNKRVRSEKPETANNIVGGITWIILIAGVIIVAVLAMVLFKIDIFK